MEVTVKYKIKSNGKFCDGSCEAMIGVSCSFEHCMAFDIVLDDDMDGIIRCQKCLDTLKE